MLDRLRRLIVPALIVLVGTYGVGYAVAQESEDPVDQTEVDEDVDDGEDESDEETEGDDDADEDDDADDDADEDDGDESDDDDEGDSSGPTRSTEGCDGAEYKNHGQFVKNSPKGSRKDAAKSDCGKPVHEAKVTGKDKPAKDKPAKEKPAKDKPSKDGKVTGKDKPKKDKPNKK